MPATTDYQTLNVEREESGLCWLRFARPDALNALSTTMVAELHRFLDSLESDESARVVIVRAEGKAFCADLEQAIAMEDRSQILASQDADYFEAVQAFMERRPPRFAGRR